MPFTNDDLLIKYLEKFAPVASVQTTGFYNHDFLSRRVKVIFRSMPTLLISECCPDPKKLGKIPFTLPSGKPATANFFINGVTSQCKYCKHHGHEEQECTHKKYDEEQNIINAAHEQLNNNINFTNPKPRIAPKNNPQAKKQEVNKATNKDNTENNTTPQTTSAILDLTTSTPTLSTNPYSVLIVDEPTSILAPTTQDPDHQNSIPTSNPTPEKPATQEEEEIIPSTPDNTVPSPKCSPSSSDSEENSFNIQKENSSTSDENRDVPSSIDESQPKNVEDESQNSSTTPPPQSLKTPKTPNPHIKSIQGPPPSRASIRLHDKLLNTTPAKNKTTPTTTKKQTATKKPSTSNQ